MPSILTEEELCQALSSVLLADDDDNDDDHEIDPDIVPYLAGMLHESMEDGSLTRTALLADDNDGGDDDDDDEGGNSTVRSILGPFLESSGCDDDLVAKACRSIGDLARRHFGADGAGGGSAGGGGGGGANSNGSAAIANGGGSNGAIAGDGGAPNKLKQGLVSMASDLSATQSDAELDANRYLWGQQNKISAMTNAPKEAHSDTTSAKDRRKARKELETARKEYDAAIQSMNESEERTDAHHGGKGSASVSAMVLPDYSSGKNERDIQVRNVSLHLDVPGTGKGRTLLSDAELRFAHRRRYGLVGKNGIGKTTLLKAMASMEIEKFPRHHRVLHVRQEVKAAAGQVSVLNAVLEADVERTMLLDEERVISARLESHGGDGVGDKGEGDGKEDPAAAASASAGAAEGKPNPVASTEAKRAKLRAMRKKDGAAAAAAAAETKDGEETGGSSSSSADSDFDADLERLDAIYERLNALSSDTAESRAATILSGLQFTPEMQRGPTSALSGGWRMRVSLAAALFVEPDLLLLDEPTNHLDLEAVLWLESYLQTYRHTLVVVSHDRAFLNEVCTDIIEFKNLKLNYYKGDYDTYVKTAEEKVKNDMRVYEAYRDKRAHMMEFIDKFRFNAKRASLVQSRIKAVEKMDAEAPEPVEVEAMWRFSIPNPEPLGRPIISVDDVSFDYVATDESGEKKSAKEFLLQKVNFGIDLDSRIGILGANGAGKSTLLNLIMDKLEPTRGSISRNGRLRIGHFTQHSADKFDLNLSAVENMLNIFEKQNVTDQEMRSFIGRFQIQGTDALKPMMMLSGGQKSRVAFASLAYQKPHVIVMDEPTNHLDMESIDALVEAVKDFRGGLIVVSHDQYFITNTCGELWVVGEGKATRFRGDFNEYKQHTLEKTAKRVAESVKSLSAINN